MSSRNTDDVNPPIGRSEGGDSRSNFLRTLGAASLGGAPLLLGSASASGLLAPPSRAMQSSRNALRRGTHAILRPNYTISRIRGPLPRPDGSIPALHEEFLRPAQRTIFLAGANPHQKAPQFHQPCGDNCPPPPDPNPTPPPNPSIVVVTKYEKTYGYTTNNYRETYVNGNLFSQHYVDGPMSGTSFPYRYAAGGYLVKGTSPGLASIQYGTTYTIGSATLLISSVPGGTLTDNSGDVAGFGLSLASGGVLIGPQNANLLPQLFTPHNANCLAGIIAAGLVDFGAVVGVGLAITGTCAATAGIACAAAGVIGGIVAASTFGLTAEAAQYWCSTH